MRILAEANGALSEKEQAMGKTAAPEDLHPMLVPLSIRLHGKPDAPSNPNEDAREALARQVQRAS